MQNKTARRTFSLLTLLLLVMLSVMALILELLPQPSLLQHAVQIIKAPNGYEFVGTYQWVAPHTILGALYSKEMMDRRRGAVRISTDIKQITFLQHDTKLTRDATNWAFAPDGRHYLCCAFGDESLDYYLCTTDSGEQIKVYSERTNGLPCEPFAWLGDSRRWLSMPGFTNDPVELRSLGDPSGPRMKIPTLPEEDSMILSSGPHPLILREFWDTEKEIRTAHIGFWSADSPTYSRQIEVPLPITASVVEVVPSPTGDRLAWLLHVRYEAIFYNRLCRLSRFMKPIPRHDSYQIWTTQLDGSSARLLGVKEVKVTWYPASGCFGAGWSHDGGVENLAWTVDARQLSFIYQNALWTIPAS